MEAVITSAPHSESGATGSPGVRLAWSTLKLGLGLGLGLGLKG